MEQRFETFTVLIARLNRSIKRLKSEQMAQLELKGPYVSCLYYLYRCGPLTAAELCDRCDEDKAAISRSLDYLEQNGYLQSRSTKAKKYKSPLTLTDKGQQAGEEVARRIHHIVELASAGLTQQEREVMYRAMEKISDNLERLTRREMEKEMKK